MSDWRQRLVAGFRNAFDLGPKGPSVPTGQERATLERVLAAVVRRRMTTPVSIFLESSRPMNGIGANAMRFFEPVVSTLVDREALVHLANFLERRGSIDWLCQRLDELEEEHVAREAADGRRGDG